MLKKPGIRSGKHGLLPVSDYLRCLPIILFCHQHLDQAESRQFTHGALKVFATDNTVDSHLFQQAQYQVGFQRIIGIKYSLHG